MIANSRELESILLVMVITKVWLEPTQENFDMLKSIKFTEPLINKHHAIAVAFFNHLQNQRDQHNVSSITYTELAKEANDFLKNDSIPESGNAMGKLVGGGLGKIGIASLFTRGFLGGVCVVQTTSKRPGKGYYTLRKMIENKLGINLPSDDEMLSALRAWTNIIE